MINLAQLWLPILLSAIGVFIASSLIHMVLRWHNGDYRKLPNEDEVRMAILNGHPTPGQYMLPHCVAKTMGESDIKRKFAEGPIGILALKAAGAPKMGPMLLQWFIYVLLLGAVVGYLGSRTLGPDAAFVNVFRLVATVSFLAFVCGSIQNGIWMGKQWRSVALDAVDALIYGVVSGAIFGWLWPH
jgi:hypothetical protein